MIHLNGSDANKGDRKALFLQTLQDCSEKFQSATPKNTYVNITLHLLKTVCVKAAFPAFNK